MTTPRRLLHTLHQDTRATVAITFMFSLPILLFILSIFTQYALIVNARIMLQQATNAAARAALTALPSNPAVDQLDAQAYPDDPDFATDLSDSSGTPHIDGTDAVNRAARIQLSALSPRATTSTSDAGTALANALANLQIPVPNSFAARYTFAAAATTLSWQRLDDNGALISEPQWTPAQFAAAPAQRIKLTLSYNFLLTAPVANTLMGQTLSLAGITGRFLTLTTSTTVQLTPGRETTTNNTGSP